MTWPKSTSSTQKPCKPKWHKRWNKTSFTIQITFPDAGLIHQSRLTQKNMISVRFFYFRLSVINDENHSVYTTGKTKIFNIMKIHFFLIVFFFKLEEKNCGKKVWEIRHLINAQMYIDKLRQSQLAFHIWYIQFSLFVFISIFFFSQLRWIIWSLKAVCTFCFHRIVV